jgi:hypothetical protein
MTDTSKKSPVARLVDAIVRSPIVVEEGAFLPVLALAALDADVEILRWLARQARTTRRLAGLLH